MKKRHVKPTHVNKTNRQSPTFHSFARSKRRITEKEKRKREKKPASPTPSARSTLYITTKLLLVAKDRLREEIVLYPLNDSASHGYLTANTSPATFAFRFSLSTSSLSPCHIRHSHNLQNVIHPCARPPCTHPALIW